MQTRAETPEIIYQVLGADEEFISMVGEYKFADDSALSALTIVTPGKPMERLKSVSGLEVLIHDVSEKERIRTIGREVYIKHKWLVYMIAWPEADGAALDAASTRCMSLFSDASAIQTIATPSGLGALAQVLVVIPSTSVCELPETVAAP
jgi:hypothetical protein